MHAWGDEASLIWGPAHLCSQCVLRLASLLLPSLTSQTHLPTPGPVRLRAFQVRMRQFSVLLWSNFMLSRFCCAAVQRAQRSPQNTSGPCDDQGGKKILVRAFERPCACAGISGALLRSSSLRNPCLATAQCTQLTLLAPRVRVCVLTSPLLGLCTLAAGTAKGQHAAVPAVETWSPAVSLGPMTVADAHPKHNVGLHCAVGGPVCS